MAWTCLVALVGLQRLSKDTLIPLPIANGIGIAKLSSYHEWQKEIYPLLRYGTTLPRSEVHSSHQSILSMEDSHARTLALQAAEKAWEESVQDYSMRSYESVAKYDRDSSSWKMSRTFVPKAPTLSPENWPAYGMIVDGVCYPLKMWERITNENDGGSWRTPDANMERGQRSKENLQNRIDRKMPMNLNDQINAVNRGMWPTPTVQDSKNDAGPSQFKRDSPGLNTVIKMHSDYREMIGGSLNPTWVEWLMGYPSEWTALEDWATQWFRPRRGKPLKD